MGGLLQSIDLLRLVAATVVVAVSACGAHVASTPAAADPCAPPGVRLVDLEPRQPDVIRRVLACNDHRFGRISDEEYRRRLALLDAEHDPVADERSDHLPDPAPLIEWASSVIDVSSQYSDSAWAATQALGPPDVFPGYGDQAKAWASLGADDHEEWIEVGFARADSISEVEVYETYNPGAIDRVELITPRGHRIDAAASTVTANPSGSALRRFTVRCTAEPIVAVRIHLDSLAVAGWNELDAIGVVPCTR